MVAVETRFYQQRRSTRRPISASEANAFRRTYVRLATISETHWSSRSTRPSSPSTIVNAAVGESDDALHALMADVRPLPRGSALAQLLAGSDQPFTLDAPNRCRFSPAWGLETASGFNSRMLRSWCPCVDRTTRCSASSPSARRRVSGVHERIVAPGSRRHRCGCGTASIAVRGERRTAEGFRTSCCSGRPRMRRVRHGVRR